ncbi:hypothetical protein [Haloglomus salinum]|uniref:hypothetical protein n=1 Tax=Haloglomus salinum TaxID=2962673 RepID=UPI0020C9AE57|nr:hypothetical protein [Haloglomus salinum]
MARGRRRGDRPVRPRDRPADLTQDDDFFTELDIERTAGVLFQQDGTLSAREVGDIVHELSEYVDQSAVVLEYVSRNWL